jgi:Fur family transcriptional regulator, zinc uptake regulator
MNAPRKYVSLEFWLLCYNITQDKRSHKVSAMKASPSLAANHERVLRALRQAAKPMRAYETFGISSPPTVYRALNRLLEDGLVHRLESINAYVTCAIETHLHGTTVFVICRDCGGVDELDEAELVARLRAQAIAHGFRPDETVVELRGQCAACSRAAH